tara:strand:- start:215 stop:613 length:399 start_codon:yes stop_codon:yes gene_type:complete
MDNNKSSSNNTSSTIDKSTVDEATFKNTQSGTTDKDGFIGDFDRMGKPIMSTNLYVTTLQVDRNFPTVLSPEKIKAIVAHSESNNKTLLVESGVAYRIAREPKVRPANDILGTPATKYTTFRPVADANPCKI